MIVKLSWVRLDFWDPSTFNLSIFVTCLSRNLIVIVSACNALTGLEGGREHSLFLSYTGYFNPLMLVKTISWCRQYENLTF